MEKSILEFQKNGIPSLEKVSINFFENPKDIAGFVKGVKDNVLRLGLSIITEQFEELDDALCRSATRRKNWEIVKKDEKSLTTSVGDINFKKTLFRNKNTGETKYLVDEILGFEKHERMTEDAEAEMLDEAAQTSYRRAGEEMSVLSSMSKQTVMNKLHTLKFPSYEHTGSKKVVENLYIDADEDHIPLQYLQVKGDITEGMNNNVLGKLIYVYEGAVPEAPKSKRYRLVNPRYFSGVYEGKDNALLWDEIWEYIDARYDVDKIKHIYLNSDGAKWITGGSRKIHGIIRVLDEFHLDEYLSDMTSHLWDSKEDAIEKLKAVIRGGSKKEFEDLCKLIYDYVDEENEGARKRVEKSCNFILNNWTAAKTRLRRRSGVIGSSTEAHVSHVLASRMSSRPMGWSKIGASQMAKLRAYYWNKGDMLELVRYQKEALPKAAGAEYLSPTEAGAIHRKMIGDAGHYEETLRVSLPFQARKQLCIKENIML